ncbi:MAG: RHS repeat protein, partial [Acidobacteria bacterium]
MMRRLCFCIAATILTLFRADISLAQVDNPPAVTAPPNVLASEGILLQVLVSVTDPDGDPILSLTASPLPAGAAFTTAAGNTSGTLSWQPSYQQAGTYGIVFTAANSQTGTDTTVIEVADTRTQANDPYGARLECGVSAATGELALAAPPNPVLGGPMPLGFDLYYASLLGRTARYRSALGENWRGTYDWRLFVAGSTAEVEDHLGATYKFVSVGGVWSLSEPTDYPHQLVAIGPELVFKHGESLFLYFFDTASGRLTKVQDLPGNQHTLTYDLSGGTLEQVSDAFGRTLTFSYDRTGLLTQWSDGIRAATLAYTGNLLSSYTDAAGKTTNFTYAVSHPIPGLLTSVQDPDGAVPYQYSYDSAGRVTTAMNAKSASFGLSYLDPEQTDVSNSEGGNNSFVHKLPGRLLRHEDAAGGITTWTYDTQGRVTDVSRVGSGLLHVAYDPASGYPSAITYPGGAQIQFAYVAKSRVPGVVWHRLATQTAPDLTQIQLDYDANGNVTQVTDEALHSWRFIRNARGQPTQVSN